MKRFRNRLVWLFMWDFRNKPAGQENEKAGREQMMRKNNRTGKRLRLTPLILGGYAAFLGFGLIVIGLSEMKEGIGIVRLLIGIGMAGFGLLGIWDGVRDLVGPNKKTEQTLASQFILTDTSGNRTSNVTAEALQKQLESLMGRTFMIFSVLPVLVTFLTRMKQDSPHRRNWSRIIPVNRLENFGMPLIIQNWFQNFRSENCSERIFQRS